MNTYEYEYIMSVLMNNIYFKIIPLMRAGKPLTHFKILDLLSKIRYEIRFCLFT